MVHSKIIKQGEPLFLRKRWESIHDFTRVAAVIVLKIFLQIKTKKRQYEKIKTDVYKRMCVIS